MEQTGQIRMYVFDRTQNSSNGGATQAEIGNLLKNFKTEMMSSISSEIDVLREKQKQAVEDLTLGILCPKCRKNHPLKECPLDKVEVCQPCELNHYIKECPSLPQVKAALQASTPDVELAYFIAQKKPWQPRNQGMTPDSFSFLNNMNNWNNMQHMNTQFSSSYSNHQWYPYQPLMQNVNSWNPQTQPPKQQNSWSPG